MNVDVNHRDGSMTSCKLVSIFLNYKLTVMETETLTALVLNISKVQHVLIPK